MKLKFLIWIFVSFLVALPLSSAFVSDQDYNRSILNIRCDEGFKDNSTGNEAPTVTGLTRNTIARPPWGNASCQFSEANSDDISYSSSRILTMIGNFSVLIVTNTSSSDCTGRDSLVTKGAPDGSQANAWNIIGGSVIEMDFYGSPTPAVETAQVAIAGGKHFNQIVYAVNKTGTTCTIYNYINQTEVAVGSGTCSNSAETANNLVFGSEVGYTSCVAIDEISIFNYTLTSNNVTRYWNNGNFDRNEPGNATVTPPDTTPPEINQNSYNMTSEGGAGCINWRTNKSDPCSTGDVTPTVNFTTNEPAWCAIGTQDINFSNYSALGVNRNCTIGQGTQSHTCTLAAEDELVYETSNIYISCGDTGNNQNRTSTSGALKLSITGLEAVGRTSIGLGIQNALLSGYTNYTDLQIYARNLSNSQVRGTFDRAAKKSSKMWAFNRIGVSDSYVNMFNLTPVLYLREFSNITSSNITLEVEKLINATK